MRKLSILLLALAACDIRPPDHEIRFDLTREELDAPPSYHQWKGALLMDIRVWRELEKKASEGNRRCSALAYDEDGLAVCAHDEEPFLIFDLTKDLPDTQNRIRETQSPASATGSVSANRSQASRAGCSCAMRESPRANSTWKQWHREHTSSNSSSSPTAPLESTRQEGSSANRRPCSEPWSSDRTVRQNRRCSAFAERSYQRTVFT